MTRCGWILVLGAAALAQGALVKVEQDWPDGTKKVRGQTLDGKRHGTWRAWFENGKMRSFIQYRAGKWHGIRREWHDNGQIALEWTYTDGREDKGTVTFFHANGKVRHTFKSGGKNKHPNQVTTTWYDNGVKESEGRWRNELQHGKWTFWYRSGKRQRVTTYKEGQPDGWSTEWDEKGKVVSKKRFKNGKLVKK